MSRRFLRLREDVNWCVSAHVSDMNNTTTLTRRQRVYTLGKCVGHAVNEGSVPQMWKTNQVWMYCSSRFLKKRLASPDHNAGKKRTKTDTTTLCGAGDLSVCAD